MKRKILKYQHILKQNHIFNTVLLLAILIIIALFFFVSYNILLFVMVIFGLGLFALLEIILEREKELLCLTEELEQSLNLKNEKLKNLYFLIDEHVISSRTDVKGIITYASQAFIDISGYSKEELVNSNHNIIRHPDMPREFFRNMWKTIKQGKVWRGEILNKKKNGDFYWVDSIISPEYGKDGNIIAFNALRYDITSNKEVDFLAHHDYLTQLPNRIHFESILSHSIKHAKRKESKFAVLFIDLDNFKTINDTLGHNAGDMVLKTITQRMKLGIRETDSIGRMGGDEFIILLENIKDKESIKVFLKKLVKIVRESIQIGLHKFETTISVGVALYPKDGQSSFELITHADNAMYYAKTTGKNKFKFYAKSISDAMKRKIEVEKALKKALKNNDFVLVYQPIYNLMTYEVCGCEVLVRLEDDNLGIISPSEFIPVAEENRMIIAIGEVIFTQAIDTFRRLKQMNILLETMSINISSKQLDEENILNSLADIASRANVDPKKINLELTEYSIMHKTEKNIDILNRLRAKGFRITIDDFGTGYSSMSYLRKLPLDMIKIDKSFIEELYLDNDNVSLTKSIIILAQSLGYKVVAEGIETKMQEDVLRKYNCDYGQGYLFSEPLKFDNFVTFMQEHIKNIKKISMYTI